MIKIDIYNKIDENFIKNKKFNLFFSKSLKKKEQLFLKYIAEKFFYCKKTNRIIKNNKINISISELLQLLKYSEIESLYKFFKNLSEKKIEYTLSENKNTIIHGIMYIINSFHFSYDTVYINFSKEITSSKNDNLFSKMNLFLFVFLGNHSTFLLYTYLIFSKNKYCVTITLEELKDIMKIDTKYERFFDFENKILKKAINDINAITEYQISYKKIKSGYHVNNKIEKIDFLITKKDEEYVEKYKIEFNNKLNRLMKLISNDIEDYTSIYEVIKTYLIKKDYDYVKQNIEYSKINSCDNLEKMIRKSLLLNYANYIDRDVTDIPLKMRINIKKYYTSTFLIQRDLTKLLREKELHTYFELLFENQVFTKIMTMKPETTYEQKFSNCHIFVHYSKNEESSIIVWTK